MRLVVALIAFPIIGAVGKPLYNQYDKAVNFQRVDARISAINEKCDVVGGGVDASPMTLMGCDQAEYMQRMYPIYRVEHTKLVQFAYMSPVDGVTHTAALRISAFPNDQPLHVGDVVPILASKAKADMMRGL